MENRVPSRDQMFRRPKQSETDDEAEEVSQNFLRIYQEIFLLHSYKTLQSRTNLVFPAEERLQIDCSSDSGIRFSSRVFDCLFEQKETTFPQEEISTNGRRPDLEAFF